jgi:hypothetical protein
VELKEPRRLWTACQVEMRRCCSVGRRTTFVTPDLPFPSLHKVGIMFIDPNPQPADPPHPAVLIHASLRARPRPCPPCQYCRRRGPRLAPSPRTAHPREHPHSLAEHPAPSLRTAHTRSTSFPRRSFPAPSPSTPLPRKHPRPFSPSSASL